jgi:hypothetical protein
MTVAQMLGYYFVFKNDKEVFVTVDKDKATNYIDAQEDKELYSMRCYVADTKEQDTE